MSEKHIKCPECGNTEFFVVEAQRWMRLEVTLFADLGSYDINAETEVDPLDAPTEIPADAEYICLNCREAGRGEHVAVPYHPSKAVEADYHKLLRMVQGIMDTEMPGALATHTCTTEDALRELTPRHDMDVPETTEQYQRGLADLDNLDTVSCHAGALAELLEAAAAQAKKVMDGAQPLWRSRTDCCVLAGCERAQGDGSKPCKCQEPKEDDNA